MTLYRELPGTVRSGAERALGAVTGQSERIEAVTGLGGGCISPAARIRTTSGRLAFIKWSEPGGLRAFFREEARSLGALEETGAVRVPAVLGVGDEWLALEWLESGRTGSGSWSALGRSLATLHRTTTAEFGWPADNWIGSLPQKNSPSADWPTFWLECRILPQWERASRQGYFTAGDERRLSAVVSTADSLLAAGNIDGPSLLHGDLWSGNVHMMADGTAAIIDPSSSFGHREVDLAMARLFGGFGSDFFETYRETWPLQAEAEIRMPLYQLYYVLVHVNLFGAGYVAQARSILRQYG